MTRTMFLSRSFALIFALCLAVGTADAAPITLTGTFSADNSLFDYNFTNSSTQTYNFFTTSYGGGTNANGTTTAAGGFVPVLTLFSSTGSVLGFGGGDATCHGSASADPKTGLCEDANFSETLAPGAYQLYLSEFPNVPVGNLSDGFLAGTDTHFTGANCGSPDGMFLQADVAPCVQRTANYSVNVTSASTSPVPEPSTWLLTAPFAALAAFFGNRRRRLA